MRGTTRPCDHDVGAIERSTHRQFHTGPEPWRVALDPDHRPVVGADDVVDGADHLGVAFDLIDEPGDDLLVRGGDAEPEPIFSARARDDAGHLVRLRLAKDVSAVDPARIEGGVVHDLRVPPLERLADQGDLAGHEATATRLRFGFRTGPAEAGNCTFGMISSTHAWSCFGSGVIVWRMNCSTPASTRDCSDATISSGVPNR